MMSEPSQGLGSCSVFRVGRYSGVVIAPCEIGVAQPLIDHGTPH